MIKSGIADYAILIPNQLLETLENSSEVSISYHPSWVNEFYLLNTKKYPTNNLWFRRAIASSIDRSVLSNYIYKNTAVESNVLLEGESAIKEWNFGSSVKYLIGIFSLSKILLKHFPLGSQPIFDK